MKKQQLQEAKNKKISDLVSQVKALKKEIVNLKIEQHLGKTRNVHTLSFKRKDVAQLSTLIKQKLIMEKTNLKEKTENKKDKKEE